jgi:hypothetical protein
MFVNVRRIFEAIRKVTWKHGVVEPERVRHVVSPEGDHTISMTLHANEVEYTPTEYRQPISWGATTPDIKKWPVHV